jgi:PASTA domain
MRGLFADNRGMSLRISARLPHAAAIALVALAATAGLTYAAGQGIGSSAPPATSTQSAPTTVVVPDVVNQAFVFAKGSLEDSGLAWKVTGSVHGYPSNTVVSQSPAAGTKLLDTGAPLVTLTLKRNAGYAQAGEPEDASPYAATADQPAELASQPLPASTVPAATTTAPATPTTPAATTPAPAKKTPAAAVQSRPPDFVVPGARKEPLDEIPLTERAAKLDAWLSAHAKPTNANVKHWLYQNEWVVTGAKLGWWHGADALRTLIAVDKRAQARWGVGAKSAAVATAALAYVEARAKK